MNFEAVRSLLLAVEYGSLSSASEHLGVPPSTVSRRINELEADLGHKILTRTPRGVRSTEEGMQTVARLRDVLLAVDACYAPPTSMARLRVTAPVEMSISFLPALLPKFRLDFPDVFVEIRGDNRFVGLVEGNFDIAIRAGPLTDSSYLSRKLPSSRIVLVAAPSMASKLRTLKQLAAAPTVEVTGLRSGLSGRWKGRPFTIQSPAIARVDSFTAALPVVLSGQAYAAFPPNLVVDGVAKGTLVPISAVELDGAVTHALYPRRHREQPALLAFIDLVAAALRETL